MVKGSYERSTRTIGYPFQTMLELGAGNGGFARAMSNLNVKMTTVELVPELVMFAKEHSTNDIVIHCVTL